MFNNRSQKGFTLLEMLVVLFITTICFVFVIPNFYDRWLKYEEMRILEEFRLDLIMCHANAQLNDEFRRGRYRILFIKEKGNTGYQVKQLHLPGADLAGTVTKSDVLKSVVFPEEWEMSGMGTEMIVFNNGKLDSSKVWTIKTKRTTYKMTMFFREGVVKLVDQKS